MTTSPGWGDTERRCEAGEILTRTAVAVPEAFRSLHPLVLAEVATLVGEDWARCVANSDGSITVYNTAMADVVPLHTYCVNCKEPIGGDGPLCESCDEELELCVCPVYRLPHAFGRHRRVG